MTLKVRKLIIVFVDLILVNLSMLLAFMIRFDWQLIPQLFTSYVYFALWTTVIRIILFVFSGMYQWSFRYASITEAMTVFKGVTAGSLLLVVVAFFSKHIAMGRSVLLIDYLFCLFVTGASRFRPRVLIKLKYSRKTGHIRALIVGAGAAGEMVVRELDNAKNQIYNLVGFIDDNSKKKNGRIHGVKVLGTTDEIKDIVRAYKIEEIIIAIPSASGRAIRNIITKCEKTETKIKTIPGLHKILNNEVSIKQIREVEPEDLLGRETAQINTEEVSGFISAKTILVTGAGGSIGSELCKQLAKFNPEQIILFDHNENDVYFLELELNDDYPHIRINTIIGDIKDIGTLKRVFNLYSPQVVFHSAAHKHVPLMEQNPASAVKNNIIGTRNFMYAAQHYKVESFVMISTDKAVNPVNIMGATKRIAEMMIQAKAKNSKTKFMSVRFGNVMGSSGSVVPIFKQQIKKGGPITVTHPEVRRFFMTASEAAQLVIQAATIGKGGEIFILDMGEQIKIIDLAKNLIILSGLEPEEDI